MNDVTTAAALAVGAAFDISQYELADTAIITLKNAKGDGPLIGADGVNSVTVEIYSPGSPQGVKASYKATYKAGMRIVRAARGEAEANDAQDAAADQVDKLVGYTKAINNFPVAPQEFYGNARLIYLHRQVEEGIGKFGNFAKGSSAS